MAKNIIQISEDVVSLEITEQPDCSFNIDVSLASEPAIEMGITPTIIDPTGEGDSSSVVTVNYQAAVAIGAFRAVAIDNNGDLIYADKDTLDHRNRILGITITAVSAGGTPVVVQFGHIDEITWSWTMNLPIYLGTNGLLTQTPPTSGILQQLGYPTSSIGMVVDQGLSILL